MILKQFSPNLSDTKSILDFKANLEFLRHHFFIGLSLERNFIREHFCQDGQVVLYVVFFKTMTWSQSYKTFFLRFLILHANLDCIIHYKMDTLCIKKNKFCSRPYSHETF